MSKYSRMEEGATDNQKRADTGPVTLYNRGFHGTSRALNRTERQAETTRLQDEYDERLEKVHEGMTRKYLAFMREQLQGFNLSNHQVVIRAAMGTTCLEAIGNRGGVFVDDMRSTLPIVKRLQELDQFLEGAWDWSHHLDGELLNPPKRSKT